MVFLIYLNEVRFEDGATKKVFFDSKFLILFLDEYGILTMISNKRIELELLESPLNNSSKNKIRNLKKKKMCTTFNLQLHHCQCGTNLEKKKCKNLIQVPTYVESKHITVVATYEHFHILNYINLSLLLCSALAFYLFFSLVKLFHSDLSAIMTNKKKRLID